MFKKIKESKSKLAIFKVVNSVTTLIPNTEKKVKLVSRIYDFVALIAVVGSLSILCFPKDVVKDNLAVFMTLDIFAVVFLLSDFILRWVVADIKYKKFHHSRLLFPLMFEPLIIWLSIIPSIANLIYVTGDNSVLEIISYFRVLRLLRLALIVRYTIGGEMFGGALKRCYKSLIMVLMIITLIVFSFAVIYYQIEGASNPKIHNFGEALYSIVISLTTIGYGDIVPLTTGGRVLIVVLSICGLLSLALPSGLVAGAFIAEMKDKEKDGSHRKAIIHKMQTYKNDQVA